MRPYTFAQVETTVPSTIEHAKEVKKEKGRKKRKKKTNREQIMIKIKKRNKQIENTNEKIDKNPNARSELNDL